MSACFIWARSRAHCLARDHFGLIPSLAGDVLAMRLIRGGLFALDLNAIPWGVS